MLSPHLYCIVTSGIIGKICSGEAFVKSVLGATDVEALIGTVSLNFVIAASIYVAIDAVLLTHGAFPSPQQ
jgi:hypothetical protein